MNQAKIEAETMEAYELERSQNASKAAQETDAALSAYMLIFGSISMHLRDYYNVPTGLTNEQVRSMSNKLVMCKSWTVECGHEVERFASDLCGDSVDG